MARSLSAAVGLAGQGQGDRDAARRTRPPRLSLLSATATATDCQFSFESTSDHSVQEVTEENSPNGGISETQFATGIYLGIVFSVSLFANILLLYVFYRKPCLRTLGNKCVISLLVGNVVPNLLLFPAYLTDILAPISQLCGVLNASVHIAIVFAILSSLCVHIDRYFAVLHPLRYRQCMPSSRASMMVAFVWVFSIAFSTWEGVGPQTDRVFKSCQLAGYPVTSSLIPYVITKATLLFLVPFLVQCWICWRIFSAARSNSERARKSSNSFRNYLSREASQDSTDGSTPPVPKYGRTTSIPRQISITSMRARLKHRMSTSSLYREEGRTARLSSLVSMFSLLSWGPFFLDNVLFYLTPEWSDLPAFHDLSIAFLFTYGAVSPFLYGYRSNRIWKEVMCVLGLRSRPKYALFGHLSTVQSKSDLYVGSTSPSPKETFKLMQTCISYAAKPLILEASKEDQGIVMELLCRGSVSSGSSVQSDFSAQTTATAISCDDDLCTGSSPLLPKEADGCGGVKSVTLNLENS
ncbi:unnamed protein product [Cyprideis torosa]|uniref:Uncharacterized protein n=1 Tax=Cyprideis torosa TaxID=163714 RepID=A0A7R8WD99_9CRUS|nr:unnamed protein product [Cyprideis torosa]CAG0894435.1 unnamed protein product [Cyprideis torosa]